MIVNSNSIIERVIQIKSGIIKHVNMNVKVIVSAQTIIFEIIAHAFVRISKKYLRSI